MVWFRRWDSKYFVTIICFLLVLLINIHLLMKKKGALAGFFFDPQPVSSKIIREFALKYQLIDLLGRWDP